MTAAALLRWESNAVTSTVHLVNDGVPVCGVRHIVLAGVDEGGIACGRCVLAAERAQLPIPARPAGVY